MKKTAVLVLASIFLLAAGVYAQNAAGSESSTDKTATTIEDLYLSQDIELQIIRGQAMSNDREMKMFALQSIRSMVEDGGLANDNPGLFVVLESLATEGTSRQVRSGGAVINNYPEVRRQAASVLTEVGGERAKNVLLKIMEEDPEPMVLAEAVYGLGVIGINDENDTVNRIVWVLKRENSKVTPDNNLAFASLLSVEKLAKASGGISNPDLINTLLEVASGAYIRDVRLKAIDVIYNLRRQQ